MNNVTIKKHAEPYDVTRMTVPILRNDLCLNPITLSSGQHERGITFYCQKRKGHTKHGNNHGFENKNFIITWNSNAPKEVSVSEVERNGYVNETN